MFHRTVAIGNIEHATQRSSNIKRRVHQGSLCQQSSDMSSAATKMCFTIFCSNLF